ncbi:MAG: 23S rRNA (uracil(1939)-C(5))-methyltransferase RlmD [Gammaproteobacteria bacterium]|nr:23S rRNA (uracil(1939)-C(5))-methyltransferase RlmD [Gammaproteobacteria bacterium]
MSSTIIDKLSHDGRGVVTVGGKKTFIDGVLPGEEVTWVYTKRHRRYDEAKVQDIIKMSSDRINPACPSFLTCGGCSYQHMSTQSQLLYKQNIVSELLQHFGGDIIPNSWLPPLSAGSSYGYRTKARLGVRYVIKKQKLIIGFREKASNYLTDMDGCIVLHPKLNALIKPLGNLILNLSIYDQIPQVEFAMGDENIILILRIMQELSQNDYITVNNFLENLDQEITLLLQPGDLASTYRFNLDRNIKDTNIPDITYSYNNKDKNFTIQYLFQPHDFTQVNLELNNLMLTQAINILDLKGNEQVLDLFCGLGNFTLPFAKILEQNGGKIIGVEGSEEMVLRARVNAELNKINNTEFYSADLYKLDRPDYQSEIYYPWLNKKYDCVILDPPRSGAKELLPYLAKLNPNKILYISCDPATFARDVGILCNQYGYKFISTGIMDMFPHTKHVETMGYLIK